MHELHYLIGNALKPIKTPAIIPHIVNTNNRWGRGFVVAISAIYPAAEKAYRSWFEFDPMLGMVQFVQVTPDICIANMLAQKGVNTVAGVPPIRYQALSLCLSQVYTVAQEKKATVHGPRFGAVLSGGEWPRIEELIKDRMSVDTYIYTLEKEKDKWPTKYEAL